MNVRDAILNRHSTRAFLNKPVDDAVITGILETARYAPSGGNLQPWHVYVLNGPVLTRFKKEIAEKLQDSPMGEGAEYNVYPPDLHQPYRARRSRVGAMLYEILGVPRDDRAGKLRQFARNYQAFDAPSLLIFCIERTMQEGQWADLGMFMQNIMLLATSEGMATCAQESWSAWYKSIESFCDIPKEQMVFCGLALGYEDKDDPVNALRAERAELPEFTRFVR